MKVGKIIASLVVSMSFVTVLNSCKSKTELVGTIGEPVDLGLSVHWADHNLGGVSMTDTGDSLTITIKGRRKVVDTAKRMWKKGWHAPTAAQMNELIDECDWRLCKEGGVEGYRVTGPNGNHIFLRRTVNGDIMDYWTSEVDKNHIPYVSFMYMNNRYAGVSYSENIEKKFIRPVIRNKHYRKIAKEDRVRDPVLLEEEKNRKEAQRNLNDAMNLISSRITSDGKSVNAEKRTSGSIGVCRLDTAMTVPFMQSTVDALDNVDYRLNNIADGVMYLSDANDVLTMRYSGLLAFVIVAESEDDGARYRIVYNNGKDFRTSYEKVSAGKECQSKVYYADKDCITNISLWSVGNKPVRLKRIRLFHSLSLNLNE